MSEGARSSAQPAMDDSDAEAVTTLYLVRHGENPANLTGEFSHRIVDYSLTPRGVRQARETAARFATQRIDAVYASPLKRAAETADEIATRLGLPVTIDERLREVNVGALETQPPTPEAWARHDEIFARWLGGDLGAQFPEGEDCHTLRARMRGALSEIMTRWPGGRVVLVAHGGLFAAALPAICANYPVARDSIWLHIPNCAITEAHMRLEGDTLRGEIQGWALCDHLSE